MNFPRYEFCKENKILLTQFIKKANENKFNKFCNHQTYDGLSKILPLIDIKKYEDDITIIDITQSDNENYEKEPIASQSLKNSLFEEIPEQNLKNMNETNLDDITYAIKENLETGDVLSMSVISNLQKPNLDGIFLYLSGILNTEKVLQFGSSLKSVIVNNNIIISCYVRHLLLEKVIIFLLNHNETKLRLEQTKHLLTEEFSERLQDHFNEFCKRYPDILKEEITNILLSTEESYSKLFLQFLDGLTDEFKSNIFKNFIFSCGDLQVNHIGLIGILLNSQVENGSLNRLVEIMSVSANKYTSEKTFGKLLMNVIKLLGKNVAALEKPLNHIIGSHRTVWKSKIQKLYDENLEDSSMMMTQSFRF